MNKKRKKEKISDLAQFKTITARFPSDGFDFFSPNKRDNIKQKGLKKMQAYFN